MSHLLKPYKIDKKKLTNLIDELCKEYRVIAPVRDGKKILFEEVKSGKDAMLGREALLHFNNSQKSPKELFFPQCDCLFSYEGKGSDLKLKEPEDANRKTVIFGMRPCDARSVEMLDKIFLQEGREDPNYKRRRDNTIIWSIGCTKPCATCFCTSMNGGPFSVEGADAIFTDIGESFVVEAHTIKGKNLLGEYLSVEADDESVKKAAEIRLKAVDLITSRVNAKHASEKDMLELFKSPIWDTAHEKCIGCCVCTFFCPTCSCFDVVDEKTADGGDRIRIWDPCTFPLYTKQASGFNPRPTGKERIRQRMLHKIKYTTSSYGEMSCVGCGRCVLNCPVNLDIRQVINTLAGGTETNSNLQETKPK